MVYDSMISLGREEEYMRVNGRPNVLTEVAQRIATVLGGVLAELEQEVVMLEIPESRTIAAQMNETIQGKRILEAEAAHTPILLPGTAASPPSMRRLWRDGKSDGQKAWAV